MVVPGGVRHREAQRHAVEERGAGREVLEGHALREDYEDGQLWIWNPQQLLAWCRTLEP